ncbi:MAG: isoleucine--tRNA ligase [bacterium]|nr:isoleucine--tRNA ligase [bacterium]
MANDQPDFPKMEEEILDLWEKNKIFQKTLEKDSPKGEFIFYEGPPTANGKPGIHHLEARAFKDCIPRYRTMRGYYVRRKGGWDTHGLPVELEVEKQLGITSKSEIEEFGIAEFNAKCKESVWKYLEDWVRFTKRIGYWVDLDNPYITYDPKYVESLWAVVKKIWEQDLLYKDYKVLPWCPRCGTALSSHELAQGYKDIKELSITAEFLVKEGSHEALNSEVRTAILAWTTTPWTLPGNVGLAVGNELDYVVIEKDDEGGEGRVRFVLAKALLEKQFEGSDYEVVAEIKGSDLVGTVYEPLYPFMEQVVADENKQKLEEKAYRVYPAEFVTTEDGTGVVHTAVMYGQDDFELGNDVGLPKHHLVNLDGTFMDGMDFLSGRFVKDEDVAIDIIKDLAHRGLLFHKEKYEHSYPHCWRCKTPVIYYARDSWYVRMSDLRDKLVKENDGINWEPAHIKDGRFGEWIREVKDWAFSRERYWGTPLPIWESEDGDRLCIGSFEELRNLAKDKSLVGESFDPHRPFVDDVVLEKNGKEYTRVKEVMDVWFDSGCMPFAQDHYLKEGDEISFPADYISEAIDQTRGWFYTLHAVGALMGKGKAYKNVISLGHILDAEGKKMSKSIGNVVEPFEMIEKYGVDSLRYWMYTVNQPGDSKNFDERTVDEIRKKVFMILWNVKSFYEMFADNSVAPNPDSENVLDKWIVSLLNELIQDATKNMDRYKVLEPARAIGGFITDLSQWYVRRSRDRFKGDDEADKKAALGTLRYVLLELSKLMAPFTPFMAERLYKDVGGEKESVHLEDWPVCHSEPAEESSILADMKLVRDIVTAALEKRAIEKMPVRQVLASATVMMQGDLSDELKSIIADEVNVKEVICHPEPAEGSSLSVELNLELTPELIAEGIAREVIRRTNSLRKNAGLTLEDSIKLTIGTDSEEIKQAIEEYREDILKGVIGEDIEVTSSIDGETFKIRDVEVGFAILKK